MALTWRLVDLANTAGLTYNFLATDVGRQRGDRWDIIDNGDGTVTEIFDLKFVDTDANIITSWAKLEAIRAQVDRYWGSQFEYNSIWYECYSASESAKRSLVTDLVIQPYKDGKYTPLLGNNALFATIAITHKDYWEATSATANVVNDSNDWTDIIDSIAAQSGDLPGKMQTTIYSDGTTSLANIWLGIKPTRYGTVNFKPNWLIPAGTDGIDTSDQPDAASSTGTISECTFNTVETMAKRMSITSADVSANYDDQVGRYHVLLRYKVGTSTICFVQLKAGYSSNTVNPPVGESKKADSTDSTNYKFLELGTVDIPAAPYKNPSYSLLLPTSWTFELWAERTAGSGHLYMDCLILIPAEHYVTIKNAYLPSGAAFKLIIATNDDDAQEVINYYDAASYISNTTESEFYDWWCPTEGGVLVSMAEGATASSIANDAWHINISNTPRWAHYRY